MMKNEEVYPNSLTLYYRFDSLLLRPRKYLPLLTFQRFAFFLFKINTKLIHPQNTNQLNKLKMETETDWKLRHPSTIYLRYDIWRNI